MCVFDFIISTRPSNFQEAAREERRVANERDRRSIRKQAKEYREARESKDAERAAEAEKRRKDIADAIEREEQRQRQRDEQLKEQKILWRNESKERLAKYEASLAASGQALVCCTHCFDFILHCR